MASPQSKKVWTTCANCGTPFLVMPSRIKTRRSCSRECMKANRVRAGLLSHRLRKDELFKRKKRIMMACEKCGRICPCTPSQARRFRFCSPVCRNKSQIKGKWKTCPECGEKFWLTPSLRRAGVVACSCECREKRWKKKGGRQGIGAPKGLMSGSRNPMFGRTPGHGRWGTVNTLWQGAIRVRSSWEEEVALALIELGEPFLYEHRRFRLREDLTYLPDFYLPRRDLWIEVKGWEKARDRQVRELFPEPLIWIGPQEMKSLHSFLSEVLCRSKVAATSGISR